MARSLDHLSKASSVWSVVFSPDGRQIISGSHDRTVHLWDSHSGQPIGSPFNSHTSFVQSIVFSPEGQQIISSSSEDPLCLWNAQNGQPIGLPFKGHTNTV